MIDDPQLVVLLKESEVSFITQVLEGAVEGMLKEAGKDEVDAEQTQAFFEGASTAADILEKLAKAYSRQAEVYRSTPE